MWLIIGPHVPLTLNDIAMLTKIFGMLDFPQNESLVISLWIQYVKIGHWMWSFEYWQGHVHLLTKLFLNSGKVMCIC